MKNATLSSHLSSVQNHNERLSTLPSSNAEVDKRITQALLDCRVNRGGNLHDNARYLNGFHGVHPEQYLSVFSQAASEALTASEIEQLVSCL
jgi:hypothetical protein